MELTPEEKQRIYEEEKVRLEMQEKLKQEGIEKKVLKETEGKKKTKPTTWGCLVLIILGMVFLGYSANNKGDEKSGDQKSTTPSGVTAGANVTLVKAILATDEKSYDEMFKSANANDTVGLVQMEAQGKIVEIKDGTKALVLEGGGFTQVKVKVRIIDGLQQGKAGWVAPKMIQNP
jgi:hypothetical protein